MYFYLFYLITGGRQKVVPVSKQETKLLIEDYDPSKDYNFKIFAVKAGKESKPLQGKQEGTRLYQNQINNSRGVSCLKRILS